MNKKNEIITPSDYLDFMKTKNTIEIRNEEEFELFILYFYRRNMILDKDVFKNEKTRTYEYWTNLVAINSKGKLDLLFECSFEKGLTFYTDRQKSIDWYHQEPIHLRKLDKETTCKYCGKEFANYMLTQIGTKDETFKVCPNCTREWLDEIIKLNPIIHKCNCCNFQEAFTITTNFSTYHLCKNHLIDFWCLNLSKKDFKQLYKKDESGTCDFELHDDFYSEDGEALQPNSDWAKDLKELITKEYE